MYKNNVIKGEESFTLAYDEEMNLFKVIHATGNIWTTYLPRQVTRVSSQVTGSLRKTNWVIVEVKYATGDEYKFSHHARDAEQVENVKKWFDNAARKDGAENDVITLMRTREKVPIAEVVSVLQKHGVSSRESDARRAIEQGIASGIEGVLDETRFVSKYALNREQVRYEIATKFEMSKEGAVVLKCPNCGASLSLQSKESQGTCKYCNASYTVPKNILGLL